MSSGNGSVAGGALAGREVAVRLTREAFAAPPREYGPVPFWWWVGERLDRERLLWQLDRLSEKGVHNAIISYNHHPDGASNKGEPEVFSPAWWELLRWLVAECEKRGGMQISFQDYTLINPLLQQIGRETPGMAAGDLQQAGGEHEGGSVCNYTIPQDARLIVAWAYPLKAGRADVEGRVELSKFLQGRELRWTVPAGTGRWLVSVVWELHRAFDPTDERAGRLLIERLYEPFETNCPGALGKMIPILFQDELDFGTHMPMWSARVPVEFARRKGYDLMPVLPALWQDLGPVSAKVRIDYADVVTRLKEESYFIPVFEWCERRGVLLGNDNCGRGEIESGRRVYGDYFRTMRWYSAPGTDDPNLTQPRAFKGLKVNSSIAHLYGRPRVWDECFHSSGWGTTPGQVVAALNRDFAYGATVVNLHGLYYSTYGSWWEWAPPDFHFRQPYWEHTDSLSGYVTRLCWLLSRGVHVCDVAMVYPITSIEGRLGRRIPEGEEGGGPAAQHAGRLWDESEAHAFGLGHAIMDAGLDFDFVDFESIERAEAGREDGAGAGLLKVAGEAYRVLLLPAMSSVRYSTLVKAREFCRAGGMVIAFGVLPRASERAGSEDAELDDLVREIFGPDAGRGTESDVTAQRHAGGGTAVFVRARYADVVDAIRRTIDTDVRIESGPLHVVHRRDGARDVYFVVNPGESDVSTGLSLRAAGAAEEWDAWTGKVTPAAATPDGRGHTSVHVTLRPGEARVVVVDRERAAADGPVSQETRTPGLPGRERVIEVDGAWGFRLSPTMDNRYGDFRLPVQGRFIGAEARRFKFSEESRAGEVPEWFSPTTDDHAWRLVTYSFGQRLWRLGPVEPGADFEALESELRGLTSVDPSLAVRVGGREYRWEPYEFSLRWGVEKDPFLQDWGAGPHGLKGNVPDDYIDVHCETPGARWYLWTSVEAGSSAARNAGGASEWDMVMGSRSAYAGWLNGREVLRQQEALPAGRHLAWYLPHYDSAPRRARVNLAARGNAMLLRFVQPPDQRVRAYAAFERPGGSQPSGVPLSLRWFANGDTPVLNPRPGRDLRAGWYRFRSPPGLRALTVQAHGTARAWVNGAECRAGETSRSTFLGREVRTQRFEVAAPSPDTVVVAVRLVPSTGEVSFGADALPEPVLLECDEGRVSLGDWCEHGLESYSGAATYSRVIEVGGLPVGERVWLDLGRVAGTARVRVNGATAATLIAAPWQAELTPYLRPGENRIEIEVANTLANHYSIGVPTPYVFPGQTQSGLLGPVRVRMRRRD